MKAVRRFGMAGVAVATALAVGLAPTAASAAAVAPPAPRPELQKALDAVAKAGVTGTLAQVRDRKGRWSGVAGVGDLATGEPVPANGRFRIGSKASVRLPSVAAI